MEYGSLKAQIKIISIFVALLIALNDFPVMAISPTQRLNSPDHRIGITIDIKNDNPVYSVWFNKQQIIRPSSLGFELGLPFNDGFELVSKEEQEADKVWKPLYGEYNELRDNYNSITLNLKEKGNPHRLLTIELRAYNEGFAFRYIFPDQPVSDNWIIKRELSQFRFIENTVGYPIYSGEELFSKIPVPVKEIKPGANYPLTLNTGLGFASVLEAFVVNYPRLTFGKTQNGDLVSSIMGDANFRTPFVTPWRAVILGSNEGQLIENECLVQKLNPVCSMKDLSWIKPGKTISNEGTFSLKTVDLKKLVDFASENGFKYLQLDWGWYGTEVKWTEQQIEGFRKFMPERMKNTGWEENAKANPFTVAKGWVPYGWIERWKDAQTFVDLDLKELIRYGNTKNIGICLYIEAGETLRENNMDSLFLQYKKWGVAGIKPGFVKYGSQENTGWIRNMVATAANHKLWVCIHDQHVPDGMERTYPNLFSVEGGGGSECNHPVVQDVMLPFTRCLAGPFDYTPFIYKQNTTNAHMMAFLVVYYNPATVVRGGYKAWNGNNPGNKGGEEIEFLKRVPSVWDETRVLKATIGENIVVARRAGKSWYVGAMTGDNACDLKINLDFLGAGKKYKATRFSDVPVGNSAQKLTTNVLSTESINLSMVKAGGCAIIFDEL